MRQVLAALAWVFLLSCQPQSAAAPAACRISHITDGDTLVLTCAGQPHRIRLLGMDTPEIFHPRCAAEARAGQMAKAALQNLAAKGPVTEVSLEGHDRYGRDLAWVSVAGRDLSRDMMALGLALPYDGRRHPNWCARLGG